MLSKRLQSVANFIPNASKVADIGTDHAYLLIYLAQQKDLKLGIASEIAQGPLNNAKENLQKYQVNTSFDLRLGDGATTLKSADEVDVLSVNGMGAKTIVHILEDGYQDKKLPKQLVLQPNTDEWQVRLWLNEHNYEILDEIIIKDKKEVYEVINAIYKPQVSKLTHDEIRFGPKLLKTKDPLFIGKYQELLVKYQNILKNIPSDTAKYYYIKNLIEEIEGIL